MKVSYNFCCFQKMCLLYLSLNTNYYYHYDLDEPDKKMFTLKKHDDNLLITIMQLCKIQFLMHFWGIVSDVGTKYFLQI